MKLTLITIFPEFFPGPFGDGMIRVAREKGKLDVNVVNLRDFTDDPHKTVDDAPFGGGPGMVMKIEPVLRAFESMGLADRAARPAGTRVLLTSPQGTRFTQSKAIEWAALDHVVIMCGRYKGVDERVAEHLVDEEFSIGDFVLSGGEPAALVVTDALARLQPDVVGCFDSVESDSFHSGLLDCAYYTRPAEFRGWAVPDVLMSGHHANIARARREEALRRTFERRPDLLEHATLSDADRKFLRALERERGARS
ncbi:MAG: tRNA (guanosine(37)-N1)-methyltransferase TrmD [Candidatus Eisenbacteria bacterium]|nr:tRNA (guanosine(37)-N1)-methyltransferase TrmD [Candidatus Eisenbacteria bacterium]